MPIGTAALTPAGVTAKILNIVRDLARANLIPVGTDGIRGWRDINRITVQEVGNGEGFNF